MSRHHAWAVRWCFLMAMALLTAAPSLAADDSTAQGKAEAGKEDDKKQINKEDAAAREVTQGALRIVKDNGKIVECPLKHTDVQADVSGFIARVQVTQTFHNPTDEPIEAVYVFPLPHEAAVDEMTMAIGERKIVGLIKRREEARRIYQQAVMQGQTAALLEQERPNIFTQTVGNIGPGQEVKIHISYVDVLKYDMGEYEFHFPMVVGPRFIPGSATSAPQPTQAGLQGKVSPPIPNTNRVPDAERISPPVLRPDFRNGHDISLSLVLDAGVPVQNLNVANHKARVQRDGKRRASVQLSPNDTLPNKDFVLKYSVVGEQPEMAVLAHTGEYSPDAKKLGGYFMLMVQPKEDERLKASPPREMVFLVDVSGSMRGDKTAKVRETMQAMLGLCRENDTVQVVTFASRAEKLFERPTPVNQASIQRALNFTNQLRGRGGTYMLQGVKMAIDEPIDDERVRIIVMLTDGFIGNESEIIKHVGKNCGDQIRFWTVGVGQSPNMFLIDGVAKQGGGMGKRLGLNDEAESLSHEVMTRIQRAQLANVKIDWGEMDVLETYPARIPELWAGRPIIVFGRYRDGGQREIKITGRIEGEPAAWPLTVDLPKSQDKHDVLAKVWARKKIEDLMHQSFYEGSPAVEEEVTALALDYRLMSQYTSFVAVDAKDAENRLPLARPPRRMTVPVPLPEGAQWEGFFGGDGEVDRLEEMRQVTLGRTAQLGGVLFDGRNSKGAELAFRFQNRYARGAMPRTRALKSMDRLRKLPATTESKTRSLFRGFELAKRSNESLVLRTPTLQLAKPSRRSRGGGRRVDAFGLDDGVEAESLRSGLALYALADQKQTAKRRQLAEAALKRASERIESDKEEAHEALLRACFLDRAAQNLGVSDGLISQRAIAQLQLMREEQVAAWTKELPALEKQILTVLRNPSVGEALKRVATLGNVTIELVPGSTEDAAKLTGRELRTPYLDLNGATVAQALDWILLPEKLTWRVEDGKIIAASQRRLPGETAWIYDVSDIAFLSADEVKTLKDKAGAASKKAAQELLQVVREQLKEEESDLVWFGPGQLLLFATAKQHDKAEMLIARLANSAPSARLPGAAGKLQVAAAKRAASRKELVAKLKAARRLQQVAEWHSDSGWRLLAASAADRLDDESVTTLELAWNAPETTRLLEGAASSLAMRSWWIVAEASRSNAGEPRMKALADLAEKRAKPHVAALIERLQKNPEDPASYAALLYAALAAGDDLPQRATAVGLLTKSGADSSPLKSARQVAKALLVDRKSIDAEALAKLIGEGVYGEDLVVLAAIASRRAGGEAWRTFRAEARDLLGEQPLDGQAVIAIHRLGANQLAITRN